MSCSTAHSHQVGLLYMLIIHPPFVYSVHGQVKALTLISRFRLVQASFWLYGIIGSTHGSGAELEITNAAVFPSISLSPASI